MTLLLQKFCDRYNYAFEDLSDPRTKSFFLAGDPLPFFGILAFYLYFVLKLGPQLMKNRRPFDLERAMVVYNLFQILSCSYLIIQGIKHTLFKYSLICEPVDYSNAEHPLIVVRLVWMYYILKITDLLDTVFFVLRKKSNQISFLHLYHHTGMCVAGWAATKYFAGGHGVFVGFLNCIVHVVMYCYYLLSAWDKEYKKNIWWKKHITHLQLVQFVILLVYFGQTVFQSDCSYPKWISYVMAIQNLLMIILFGDFYVKNYIKPQQKWKLKNNGYVTHRPIKEMKKA